MAELSERGVAQLFAEGDGVVLAMAGSTASDRREAAERLPSSFGRPTVSERIFGVLLDAGEAGSHYSEEEGWGLTVKTGQGFPNRELEVAAEVFRASRDRGSLAVAGTKAKRRRIEANRKRLRAGCVARRRRDLVPCSARPARPPPSGTRTPPGPMRRRKVPPPAFPAAHSPAVPPISAGPLQRGNVPALIVAAPSSTRPALMTKVPRTYAVPPIRTLPSHRIST